MIPKLNRTNNFQIQIIILWIILIVTIIFFVDNRYKMAELERKIETIDKELYLKEITFQKRQKEFDQQAEKHRKQIEEYKRSLKKRN